MPNVIEKYEGPKFVRSVMTARPDVLAMIPVDQYVVLNSSSNRWPTPKKMGVFGITGNHDGDLLGPRLEGWNMRFMNRRFARLEGESAAVEVIGLPGVRRTSFDPIWLANLPARQPGVPRIVLGHFPDQVRYIAPLSADLMLTGHTHGGQVRLPFVRPLALPPLGRRYVEGRYQLGELQLYVNRGIGTVNLPIRLNCPPEITLFTLRRG